MSAMPNGQVPDNQEKQKDDLSFPGVTCYSDILVPVCRSSFVAVVGVAFVIACVCCGSAKG